MTDANQQLLKAVVTRNYKASYPDPIEFSEGAVLILGKKDPEWPGWVWCTNSAGKSGWVPEKIIVRQIETGLAVTQYSARELTVNSGDVLTLISIESGWYWAETRQGITGWVPGDHLRIESSDQNVLSNPAR